MLQRFSLLSTRPLLSQCALRPLPTRIQYTSFSTAASLNSPSPTEENSTPSTALSVWNDNEESMPLEEVLKLHGLAPKPKALQLRKIPTMLATHFVMGIILINVAQALTLLQIDL